MVDDEDDDVVVDNDVGVSVGVSSIVDGGAPHGKRVFSLFFPWLVASLAESRSLLLLLSLLFLRCCRCCCHCLFSCFSRPLSFGRVVSMALSEAKTMMIFVGRR